MPKLDSQNRYLLGTGLLIVAVAVFLAVVESKKTPPLPILKQLPDFTLTNQFGEKITLAALQGKIYLADIIFTRCAGPCPRMTQQLRELQANLHQKNLSIHLLTLTADPAFDSLEVLQKYGEKFGAKAESWWFLTGAKKELYSFAMHGLMLGLEETTPEKRLSPEDLFIHSTMFVLVDRAGQVRSVYESSEPGVAEKITSDVKRLIHE